LLGQSPVRQSGLGPAAEEVSDIGVFGIEVGSRRFHDRAVDLRLQGDLLAMCQEKGMNLRHTPNPFCSIAICLPAPPPSH